MELTGKIIEVLAERSGVSNKSGNAWKVASYVIETQEQYPKRMCFEVFGEDKIQQFNINKGELLTISFDVDSHEYQGRWFNQIRAWKVSRNEAEKQMEQEMKQAMEQQAPPIVQTPPFAEGTNPQVELFANNNEEKDGDLPF